MSIERVRSACRSLELFGTWLAWGLPFLGLLSSVDRLLAMTRSGVHGANSAGWSGAFLDVASVLTAYSLAGMGAFAFSSLLAAVVTAHIDHLVLVSQSRSEQMNRVVVAIEQVVGALESWNGPASAGSVAADDRARSLAEIKGAITASLWDQANAILDDFTARFPEDPALVGLHEDLANAKQRANREQLAQLDAAREVNDPDRVLEIYQAMLPSLEIESRIPLERELAKWFLTLIHRRLRTGAIQADVVHLASRIAEIFATTVEGASVRAALPTLRRSIGLCPRCSQPYTGLAEACPNCVAAGTS